MNKLIDTKCPQCGRVAMDVWVASLEPASLPTCACGTQTERAWVTAPGITPLGTRPERVVQRAPQVARVDTKAIAAEKKTEIEQKWLRFSDERVAEEHVRREINHKAGMCDEAGNVKPVPTPEPITFAKPPEARMAAA